MIIRPPAGPAVKRLRLCLLALWLIVMGGSPHAAQEGPHDPADSPWGTIQVPGGFAALQQTAMLAAPADEWRTLPLLIELSFAGLEGLRFTRLTGEYAAALRRLHQRAAAIAPDRSVTLAMRTRDRGGFDDLLDTLGFAFDERDGVVRARTGADAEERQALFRRAGVPVERLAARLNAGEAVALATADSPAPLPLGAAFWTERFIPAPPAHDLLWAILSSREMSSLYYGLLAVDDATLRAVAADPALAKALVRHALVVPTAAPALRVRNGHVLPPAGDDAATLWEDLVGKRLDRPAEFVNALLGADDGRLAHFYATVASLPAGTAAFVAGKSRGTVRERRETFGRLYAAHQGAIAGWRADALVQPARGGPAEVLVSIRARADGSLAGPPWTAFWRRAFDSEAWPADAARELGRIDDGDLLDAAGLLALVCPGLCDERRLAAFTLVQREFPDADLSLAPALLSVVRTRLRYPALALEIERMHLGDPTVYARLGAAAARIERLDQPVRTIALVQFQAAVALLGRLRSVGAPAPLVREHAGRLGALVITAGGFDGSLVRWLVVGQGSVLATGDVDDPDVAAERSAAGAPWQRRDVRVEWEGVSYLVDVAATEQSRIRDARSKFSSSPLQPAVALLLLADDLPEARAAGRLEAWSAAVDEVVAAAREPASLNWARAEFDRVSDLPRRLAGVLRGGRRGDRDHADEAAGLLRRAADLVAADALAGLVYAIALHNVDGGLAMSTELPRRHQLETEGAGPVRLTPWDIPAEPNRDLGRRHITGSLLALDAGVTELGVRRMGTGRPAEEPNMAAPFASGLWRTAALARPWAVAPDETNAIDDARARGEAIVAGWAASPPDDPLLRRAGIAGPRAGWLRWRLARGEPPQALLSLEDVVRLAGWTSSAAHAWGAGASPSNCLCLVMPAVSWEVRGRPRDPMTAAESAVEPALRVAVELRRRGLPSALAPGVLALLVTDLVEQSTLPHPLDVAGLAEALRRVPPERFDDYIAAVAARGPLVRAEVDGEER